MLFLPWSYIRICISCQPNSSILLYFSSLSLEPEYTLNEIMAMFIRAKRVSDPLDDRVKARLLNDDGSSGSEREAAATDTCLSNLVHAFFDPDESTVSDDANDMTDGTVTDGGGGSHTAHANDVLAAFGRRDQFRDRLRKDVMQSLSGLAVGRSACRRLVMAGLREHGYDAGICGVKWEKSGGLTAGSYEYVDVLTFGGGGGDDGRYIVDLDFRAQFEVARATEEYEGLVATLPSVMVGKAGEVKQAVRVMAEAAKRSLRSRDLSLPPWRKRRYMVNKWFGPHRRTTSPLPSADGAAVAGRSSGIQYCVTGFVSVLNAQRVQQAAVE